MAKQKPTQADYAALAEFRYVIRCFLEFSEKAAKQAGLTPRHHQAILVIKGYGDGRSISIRALAERLRIRHNTAVELVDRLCESALLERTQDEEDQRRVLLRLTPVAEKHLAELSNAHLNELSRIAPTLKSFLERE